MEKLVLAHALRTIKAHEPMPTERGGMWLWHTFTLPCSWLMQISLRAVIRLAVYPPCVFWAWLVSANIYCFSVIVPMFVCYLYLNSPWEWNLLYCHSIWNLKAWLLMASLLISKKKDDGYSFLITRHQSINQNHHSYWHRCCQPRYIREWIHRTVPYFKGAHVYRHKHIYTLLNALTYTYTHSCGNTYAHVTQVVVTHTLP